MLEWCTKRLEQQSGGESVGLEAVCSAGMGANTSPRSMFSPEVPWGGVGGRRTAWGALSKHYIEITLSLLALFRSVGMVYRVDIWL